MKPFNLEEAKAGKPFFSLDKPENPCAFIGVSSDGTIVCEHKSTVILGTTVICSRRPEYLCMASEKIVRYTTVYALFNALSKLPLNSLEKLKGLGHWTADNVASCSACNPQGLVALQPTLRIEWEE